MSAKKKELTFEDNLKRLEEIVNGLETGEFSLDESLKLFEEGIGLVKECQGKLEKAERKVEVLIKDDKENISIKDFEQEE